MNLPVLLVATATRWYGTARIPRALARAGFDVCLLAPMGSLAEHSRYIGRIGHLPDDATPMQWVHAFAATVKATGPRLVLPCDDMSFQLLQTLALTPPENMKAALQIELAALIRESLGDPAWYRTSVDKTLLPAAAEALGVRVPRYRIVRTAEEAEAFATVHGYPIVVKRGLGFAGNGVAICSRPAEIAGAIRDLAAARALDLGSPGNGTLIVQAHVPGAGMYYQIAAWKGDLLAGMASDKVVANPAPMGPATVIRYHRSPEGRDFAQRLVRGFGITGLLGLELIVHEHTGQPYLLEINRRITPGTHRGSTIGLDLCAALHAAIGGTASPSRTDLDEGEEAVIAHFPQEWLRDPESPYLRTCPVDVPWDEPELIEAMLALRNEN